MRTIRTGLPLRRLSSGNEMAAACSICANRDRAGQRHLDDPVDRNVALGLDRGLVGTP